MNHDATSELNMPQGSVHHPPFGKLPHCPVNLVEEREEVGPGYSQEIKRRMAFGCWKHITYINKISCRLVNTVAKIHLDGLSLKYEVLFQIVRSKSMGSSRCS